MSCFLWKALHNVLSLIGFLRWAFSQSIPLPEPCTKLTTFVLVASTWAAILWFCLSFLTGLLHSRSEALYSLRKFCLPNLGKGQALSCEAIGKITFPKKTNTFSLSYLMTQPLLEELGWIWTGQTWRLKPTHSSLRKELKGHSLKSEKMVPCSRTLSNPGQLLASERCCKDQAASSQESRAWHWDARSKSCLESLTSCCLGGLPQTAGLSVWGTS
jgi:hypothetical protein